MSRTTRHLARTTRKTRTALCIVAALSAVALLAGCSTTSVASTASATSPAPEATTPVADLGAPEATATPTPLAATGNPEVDELVTQYNALIVDYHNAYINLYAMIKYNHAGMCAEVVFAEVTKQQNQLFGPVTTDLKTLENQAASNQVDYALVKTVQEDLNTLQTENEADQSQIEACIHG
jgi:uncharacterized protein (DUF305 family)